MKNYKIIATKNDKNVKAFNGSVREKLGRFKLYNGYKAVIIDDRGELKTLLDLRVTCSPSGAWYACAWFHGSGGNYCTASTPSNNVSGGYNKRGSVIFKALQGLGYDVECVYDGVKPYPAEGYDVAEMIKAICKAEGFDGVHVVEMHP